MNTKRVFYVSSIVVLAVIAVVVSLFIKNNYSKLKADVSSYNKFSLADESEFVNLTCNSYRIKVKVNGARKNVKQYTYYASNNGYSKSTKSSSFVFKGFVSDITVTASGEGQEDKKIYKFDPVREYISQLYMGFRGSKADEAGLNYWVGVYNNEGINSVIKKLYLSEEAKTNLDTNNGFVTAMYKGIFGRNPDTTGLNFWVNKLNSGLSRETVLNSFFGTKEFKKLVSFYNFKSNSIVKVTSINLNVPKRTLAIGETVQVIPTVLPENATDKAVRYSSSNASVATVDVNGNIKAVGVGTAKILVTSVSNSKVRKQISIVVKNNEVKVTSINLNVPKRTLAIGEMVQVIPTVLPENATDKTVRYSSSNASVATVDTNGNIKAVGTGNTKILVTSVSNPKVRKQISIVVKNTNVKVTSLKVSVTKRTLAIGETVQVIPTISPENATNKTLRYSSSNASVATVDEKGIIKAVGTGKTKILVTSVSNPKVRKQISIAVKSTNVKVTGLKINISKKNFVVGESTQIETIISPENATNKELKYSSSNPDVATVDSNGNIKGKKEGKTTITVTSVSNPKIKKQVNIIVKKSTVVINISKSKEFTKNKTVTLKNTSGNKKAVTYYQINATDDNKWIEYKKPFKLNENCTLYVKNSDVIYTRKITKIDNESPILSDDITVKYLRNSSYSISIKVNDKNSGLNKYTYTVGKSKVTKKFSKNKKNQTITLKISNNDPSKYIKLVVKDNVGNSTTKKYTINALDEYISQLYNGMRGNKPDKEGLEYWKKQYSSNSLSMNGIIRNIYLSSEANQRLNTNSKFVEGVYSGIFGRTASDNDKEYWTNKLDKGMTRKDFINTILKTDEYKKLVKLYQFSTKVEYPSSAYSANVIYNCPEGWTSDGKGTCTKVTQYECGTYACGKQPEAYDCKTPKYQWGSYKLIEKDKVFEGQRFSGTRTDGNYQYRNCRNSVYYNKTWCDVYEISVNTEYTDGKCYKWVDKMCTKVCNNTETTNASKGYSCSNDAILKGDSCYYCPKGGTYDSNTNKCIIE